MAKVKKEIVDRSVPQRLTTLVEPYSYDIDISLADVIEKLQRDLAKYTEEGWTDLFLALDTEPYSEDRYVYLKGRRLETAEEVARRIAREDRAQSDRETRERQEFERLSKLYGRGG